MTIKLITALSLSFKLIIHLVTIRETVTEKETIAIKMIESLLYNTEIHY